MRVELINFGCDKSKIIKHHLGVDMLEFRPKSRSRRGNAIIFLIVANFVEKKGIEIGIRAFSKLLKTNPDVKLNIIGQGPLEKKYLQLVGELGVNDSVEILNNYKEYNPRKFVISKMQEADVFLLPSISTPDDYGGTPIVLMEAGAMRLPVITTNNAGNAEIIAHNETGLLVKEMDENDLSRAMEELAQSVEIRTKFGESARKYIEKEFNHTVQMKKLYKIYQDAIQRGQ